MCLLRAQLASGGHVVYTGALGHHAQTLISYLEAIPGIPAWEPHSNPATWMLDAAALPPPPGFDVTAAAMSPAASSHSKPVPWLAAVFASHESAAEHTRQLASAASSVHLTGHGAVGSGPPRTHSAPLWLQVWELTARHFMATLRAPDYTAFRLILVRSSWGREKWLMCAVHLVVHRSASFSAFCLVRTPCSQCPSILCDTAYRNRNTPPSRGRWCLLQ